VLKLVARIRPAWGSRVWSYPLAVLALSAFFLAIPGVRASGCVALACGITVWLVPAMEAHAASFGRIVCGSFPALAIIVCLLAACSFARGPIVEHAALRNLPTTTAAAPNILLVVMDTVRADALGLHGYHRDTSPNLTRLARKGVRFEQAIAPATWTLPSHASIFTGRWPDELSVGLDFPLDSTFPTLAEYLSARGYATAGFAANTYFCNRWYGIDRGFVHYEDYIVAPLEVLRSSALGYLIAKRASSACDAVCRRTRWRFRQDWGADSERKDANRINRDALAWLASRDLNRPYFVFLNYLDAHDPYVLPHDSTRHFGAKSESPAEDVLLRDWLGRDKRDITTRQLTLARDAYDDCIAYLDGKLGELFQRLEQRGLLENTVVIVTSDHGEHFGEHGLYGHRGSVYQAVSHVPLIVFGHATIAAGTVVHEPVSLRNLPATIADILGQGPNSPFPGSSLASTWMSGTAAPNEPPVAIFSYASPALSARDSKNKPPEVLATVIAQGKSYIRGNDGHEELYDLVNDPAQEVNRIASEHERDLLVNLRRTALDHCRQFTR
jgi:arylsulfatase A-like enzyme